MNATNSNDMKPARKPRTPRTKKAVEPPPKPEPVCSLCGGVQGAHGGNNIAPLEPNDEFKNLCGDGGCCDDCNMTKVIPARLARQAVPAVPLESHWQGKLQSFALEVPKEWKEKVLALDDLKGVDASGNLLHPDALAQVTNLQRLLGDREDDADLDNDDEHACDEVLANAIDNGSYAVWLMNPMTTVKASDAGDEEAEALWESQEEEGQTEWGYKITRRHHCVVIYTASPWCFDAWRVMLGQRLGDGELLDDDWVWN